jgi:hypothetical protein
MRGLTIAAVLLAVSGALLGGAGAAGPPTLVTPSIQTGPADLTQQATATFTFTNNEPDPAAILACRLDAGDWIACASPYDLPAPVADGSHMFEVRAIVGDPNDPAERSRPAEWAWTVDTTPPSLPVDQALEATSALGAVADFAVSDNLDPSPQVACDHDSGAVFPIGQTVVSCTAEDEAGNQSEGTFTVTVADTIAPVLGPHPDVVVLVPSSAAGALVDLSYGAALVIEAADPAPTVTCSPASGSFFPIGSTTVACSAEDASGNISDADSFDVLVQVGPVPAKPTLTADVKSITSKTSVQFTFSADADVTLDCRLQGPGQTGDFEPCQSSTAQSYSSLEDGSYLFTLRVMNSVGNISEGNRAWLVDTEPPARVTGFRTRSGNGWVRLGWTKPGDLGYDHVLIRRKRAGGSSWKTLGIRRDVTSMVDREVRNDVAYTYAIRSVDKAGNRSAASLARGRPSRILSPQFDAVLLRAPLIDWVSIRHASYYNIQIWRNKRKILSAWPLKSAFQLHSSWTYGGKHYSLSADRYLVYVWPGYGSKASNDYGPLVGWSAFVSR